MKGNPKKYFKLLFEGGKPFRPFLYQSSSNRWMKQFLEEGLLQDKTK